MMLSTAMGGGEGKQQERRARVRRRRKETQERKKRVRYGITTVSGDLATGRGRARHLLISLRIRFVSISGLHPSTQAGQAGEDG
jgi:hypothetical protein